MKIFALIPARGGSKEIPRKNVIPYKGKPLIVHSIEIAKKCGYIEKIYVSTEDKEISDISTQHGAIVIDRPMDLSQDLSTDFDVFQHFISVVKIADDDIIVHLRPTYPERNEKLLDECIEKFIKDSTYDSLRTVFRQDKTPFKMYRILDGNLTPLFKKVDHIEEPYNQCRQILPTVFLHNGCIDITKASTIKKGSMTGEKILPVIMSETDGIDIDTYEDLRKCNALGYVI